MGLHNLSRRHRKRKLTCSRNSGADVVSFTIQHDIRDNALRMIKWTKNETDNKLFCVVNCVAVLYNLFHIRPQIASWNIFIVAEMHGQSVGPG